MDEIRRNWTNKLNIKIDLSIQMKIFSIYFNIEFQPSYKDETEINTVRRTWIEKSLKTNRKTLYAAMC